MNVEPNSLYVHIPFCIKKCRYCDFYSIPYNDSFADRFIHALVKEWGLVKNELALGNATITTIFFGGGTPSMLSQEQWKLVDKLLIKTLRLSSDVEWTIECNPDSFTEEKAALWLSMGVTRLTFGVQSLIDRELTTLGRPHTAQQALTVLQSPILSKFKSIGTDLMYGLPGQTVPSFEKSIQAILSHPVVSHLSAYELTINPHTPFGRHVSKIPFPPENTVLEMARLLFDRCRTAGFERYEISNFAKHGHRCRHNEAYWDHSPYIGLGPAAHSYNAPYRFANNKNISNYITELDKGKRPLEFAETINNAKMISEMIFLRLRTTAGLDEEDFAAKTKQVFYAGNRKHALDDLIKGTMIEHKQSHWSLTEQGMFVADAIVRRLV
jgi:oxygen-independent coproporphyrinogen-3 oxidase